MPARLRLPGSKRIYREPLPGRLPIEIALARIDDRLIHGQVVTAWLPTLGRCDEILVCDDRAAGNPFVQQVLRMAAPPGQAVRVLSMDETIVDFRQKANDARRVLLLARGPETVLCLLEGGVSIYYLNVGESEPGRAAGGCSSHFRSARRSSLRSGRSRQWGCESNLR
jgi:mannose/fructose/N-acetylgalactosamine-specific phosphotransferase system component IIB